MDYDILVATARMLWAKRILEFGPGASTYAFIEWWADIIHTYEADPDFADKYNKEFENYIWIDVRYGEIYDRDEHHGYDLAFVDWPRGIDSMSRFAPLDYAIKHSKVTILHDSKRPGEMESLSKLEGYEITHINTQVWLAFITKK